MLYEFDFAFSFAGEIRKQVEQIANGLKAHGKTVFYDNNFQSQLLGEDLYRKLRCIYRSRCRFVVCFISKHYINKSWTNLELTSIKERFIDTFFAEGFLLPICVGNVKMLDDIPSFIGYYQHKCTEKTVKLLVDKIESQHEEYASTLGLERFISYTNQRIISRLSKYPTIEITYKDGIEIRTSVELVKLQLRTEQRLPSSCMLGYITHGETPIGSIPDFIVTWFREDRIRFAVYKFYELKSECNMMYNIDDVAVEICEILMKVVGL